MNWKPIPHHQHQAVHRQIYNLRFAVEEFRPRRNWDVALRTQSCQSRFDWKDGCLNHPEFGPLLTLAEEPDWRTVTLKDVPDLKARDGDSLPSGAASSELRLRLRRDPDAAYYGLGQRVCSLRRDPGVYCNWTVDPPWGHHKGLSSLYQAHPYLLLQRPGLALGIFLNSTWFNRFDLGESQAEEICVTTLGGEIDLYVLAAESPAQLCSLLADLTGYSARPPRWALGYHQSRWGYQSQAEIEALVEHFRQRQIPLDVIHLDIDYMDQYRSFTFDPNRFPDPEGLSRSLKERGVRLVSIIDPGIRFDLHSQYTVAREGAEQGHFLRNPDGSPLSAYCWPDAALFTDYSKASARNWWGRHCDALIERGISGIWIDMNEPAVFSQPFSQGFSQQHPFPLSTEQGEGTDQTIHAELHNLYGHQMAQATRQSQQVEWVLTRSAFTGTQRYAFAWMGDNHSWWEHLALTLPQLCSMGLSGMPFVGVDVGGFFGNTTAELLERWMEQAVFYPFMRNHSAMGTRPQEPWQFGPEAEQRIRDNIRLRYRLLPYLESLACQACEFGWPLLRPLFYEFPNDPEAALHEDQALLGPHLMLAPVTRPGHRQRMVYFPRGKWYDFWSDRSVNGPAHRVWPAPLGQMPLFVRQGAAIPAGSPIDCTDQAQELEWWLFPGNATQSGVCQRLDGRVHQVSFNTQEVIFDPPAQARVILRTGNETQIIDVTEDTARLNLP